MLFPHFLSPDPQRDVGMVRVKLVEGGWSRPTVHSPNQQDKITNNYFCSLQVCTWHTETISSNNMHICSIRAFKKILNNMRTSVLVHHDVCYYKLQKH